MAITINGSANTVAGLAVGGLPDGVVDADTLASNAVTNVKVADDAIGVAELSTTGTAGSSNFLRGDNSWQAAGGGKVVNFWRHHQTTNHEPTKAVGGGWGTWENVATLTITPASTSNKLILQAQWHFDYMDCSSKGAIGFRFRNDTAGTDYDNNDHRGQYDWYPMETTLNSGAYVPPQTSYNVLDVPNTSSQTWKAQAAAYNENSGNRTQQVDIRSCFFTIMEVEHS